MSELNYGHEARMKISRWVKSGMLHIDHETGHWTWHGSTVKGVPMMRYGGRLYPVHRYLFKSFYSQFEFESSIFSGCDCEGCVNPLHRFTLSFIDLRNNAAYELTKSQAKELFNSSLNAVTLYGVYDAKETPSELLPEVSRTTGLDLVATNPQQLDLPLLRQVIPQFKSVKLLPRAVKNINFVDPL